MTLPTHPSSKLLAYAVSSISPSLQQLPAWPVKYCCSFLINNTALWGLGKSPSPWPEPWQGTLWPTLIFGFPNALGHGCSCTMAHKLVDDYHGQRAGGRRTRDVQRSCLLRPGDLVKPCLSFRFRPIFHLVRNNDWFGMMFWVMIFFYFEKLKMTQNLVRSALQRFKQHKKGVNKVIKNTFKIYRQQWQFQRIFLL